MSYRVFTRTWWKKATSPGWPNGLEPCLGRKYTLHPQVATEQEARDICAEWNRTHKPGKLSRKAEYQEN